jgi:hypothetical protein
MFHAPDCHLRLAALSVRRCPPHRAQHAPRAATPCTRPTHPAATPAAQPRITPLPHASTSLPPRHTHATPAARRSRTIPSSRVCGGGHCALRPPSWLLRLPSAFPAAAVVEEGGGGGSAAHPPPPPTPPLSPAGAAPHPWFLHRHAHAQHRVRALAWPRTLAPPPPPPCSTSQRAAFHTAATRDEPHTLTTPSPRHPTPTPPTHQHRTSRADRVTRLCRATDPHAHRTVAVPPPRPVAVRLTHPPLSSW